MKPLLDIRIWLAVLATGVVVWLTFADVGRRSPGPLAASHFHAAALPDDASCVDCHGGGGTTMAQACNQCHAVIGEQLASASGLHGSLSEEQGQDCGACHPDHHGRDFEVVGALSFRLAGFERREDFDHGMLEFGLEGAHQDLSCADCHPHADRDWLRKGERRFLGQTQDCASCHEDAHDGRMTRGCAECHGQEWPFAEVAAFNHVADFPLDGGHARQECKTCHPEGSAHAIEALDGKVAREDWRDCASCHETPHSEDFVTAAAAAVGLPAGASCSDCHPHTHLEFRTAGESFTLAQHEALTGFALEAPHDTLNCADCHGGAAMPGDPTSLDPADAPWMARFPGRVARDCASCHSDPHGGQFADSPHAAEGCTSCHAVHAFDPPTFGIAEHAALALPLEGKHAPLTCAECHTVPDGSPDAPRQFRGTAADCASCHGDAHRGFFGGRQGLASGAADCALCHDAQGFDHGTTERFAHEDWTGFPLDGAHAQGKCASCHPDAAAPDATGRSLGFVADHVSGPPQACRTCHADVHLGAFSAPDLPTEVGGRTECARCHDTASFAQLHAPFAHGDWTGFALAGAHAQAECATCHGAGGGLALPASPHDGMLATPELARRLGLVEEHYPGDPASCATCHSDPHGGLFDRADVPVPRAGDCARCHSEVSFRLASSDFNHAGWTGFGLEGAHAEVACTACHTPGTAGAAVLPDGRSRRLGPVAGRDCASCHADPHVGQFRDTTGAVDCARCHAVTGEFALAGFDHDRDTRFELDKDHARLDCASCHQPFPLPGGGEAVRYRPLGRECSSCHGFR